MTMSTEVVPAAAPAASAAPPEPSPVDALKAAAQAKAARRPAARAPAPPAPAPSDVPAPEATAPEPPAEISAPEPGDSSDLEALKVRAARALHAARAHERRFREAETRAKQLEEQLSPLRGDDVAAKIAFAQKHGLDLRAWTDHVLSTRGHPAQAQPPADGASGSDEIAALRKELDELKGGEQRRAAESLRQQEMGVIDRACESNDRWSIIRDLGRQEAVYERFYQLQSQQGYAPRLPDVLDEVSEQIAGGAKQLLRHDAVRRLAKADPELFDELREYFAAEVAQDPAEAASEAPASPRRRGAINQERLTPSPSGGGRRSYAERKRAAVSRLQSLRR